MKASEKSEICEQESSCAPLNCPEMREERPEMRQVGRRNFLKKGTLLASLPVLVSLTAHEARAESSGGS